MGTIPSIEPRVAEGTYAMVYAPVGRSFKVNMSAIRGPRVTAWWFNPRDGIAEAIGELAITGD